MKIRTGNDSFDVESMVSKLEYFARQQDLSWDWEFLLYSKNRRGLGPDREGLLRYSSILEVILEECPTGRPSLAQLKLVWLELNRKWKIKANCKVGESDEDWAYNCGDMLRIMCDGVINLSKSKTVYLTPEVKALQQLVKAEVEIVGHKNVKVENRRVNEKERQQFSHLRLRRHLRRNEYCSVM